MGKGRLVEMTTGVKPLTIIGSLDDMFCIYLVQKIELVHVFARYLAI
jgi:hypothetical protein